MNVHPAIRALRGDWASQRRAQEPLHRAIIAWQRSSTTRALEAEIERHGDGANLAECEALSAILGDHRQALAWLGRLFERLMPAIRQEPLGDLPMRFSCSEGFATIQLLAHERATLNVVAHEPRPRRSRPETVLLVDRESTELLLNGRVEGVLHRSVGEGDPLRFESQSCVWQAGDRIELAASDGRHLLASDHTVLTLQLVRSAGEPRPTRKYNIGDGCLLQTASGDKQASRDLMALGVLGAMPAYGAIEVMEQIGSDTDSDPDLRWEAVRQALVVDPAIGFALLAKLERHSHDPLALPAARLKSQLIAAHPRLAEFEQEAA